MKRKGICMVCACTEADACNEGCQWANLKQTLCSACKPLSDAQRKQKREEQLERLTGYLAEFQLRIAVLQTVQPSSKPGGLRKRTQRQQPRFSKGIV